MEIYAEGKKTEGSVKIDANKFPRTDKSAGH
jgi:hypothetical protein